MRGEISNGIPEGTFEEIFSHISVKNPWRLFEEMLEKIPERILWEIFERISVETSWETLGRTPK